MSTVKVCAGFTVTKSVMFSFCFTLVADQYPLIWPVASSAVSPWFSQPAEPGCWFSARIGFGAAIGADAGAPIAAPPGVAELGAISAADEAIPPGAAITTPSARVVRAFGRNRIYAIAGVDCTACDPATGEFEPLGIERVVGRVLTFGSSLGRNRGFAVLLVLSSSLRGHDRAASVARR